jgi:L-ascorbate metabolism protein UlaG (beta-lactamase superfamily)
MRTRFRAVTLSILAVLVALSGATAVFAQRPAPDTIPAAGGDITVIPITHGTVELVQGSHVILVDPARSFADPRYDLPAPPPPGTGRGAEPPPSARRPAGAATKALYAGLEPPTVILVTDIHDDHFDPEVIALARSATTVIVGPSVIASQLAGAGHLANGQTKTVDGITIEAVPMYNLTVEKGMDEPFHTKGRGNGYVVSLGGTRIFFAGDTSCTPDITALKNIDVAFLPMNLPFTMSAKDAVDCAKAFKPKIVYPYHYLGPEPQGPAEFAKALAGSGVDVRVKDWYVGVPFMHPNK